MKYRGIYLFMLVSLIILGYCFKNTNGLIAYIGPNNAIEYVKEMVGSSADDNIVIEASFLLFFIPLIASIFRRKKEFSMKDGIVFLFFWIVNLVMLFDSLFFSTVFETIEKGNFILLMWLVNFVAIFLFNMVFMFFHLRNILWKKYKRYIGGNK